MLWRLLCWPSKQDRELMKSLKALKTLKVTRGGGMSIDPLEIIRSKEFIAASRVAKRIVERDTK